MDIKALHRLFLSHPYVFTDSRKVIKNGLFFALKGDNFNGNKYAESSIEQGAAFAIVDEFKDHPKCILVNNALQTLQNLAHYHRIHLGIPIIGITGSNGKTTTKELLYAVLRKKFKTNATQGNLNNHIGVPLTLLTMNASTEIGIIEMGANHIGEIAFLTRMAEPNFGYITNFGKAHLEGFGSIEGVIQGKSELYEYLKKQSKTIFVNSNDSTQLSQLTGYDNTYRFGLNPDDDCIIAYSNNNNTTVVAEFDGHTAKSQLIGAYNFTNIAIAIAVGTYFNVPPADICKAIEGYESRNNRSQIIRRGKNTVILDAYNANPTSMRAALDHLSQTENSSKVVVLGDMLELGDSSASEHQGIASLVESMNLSNIYLVGPRFYETQTKKAIKHKSVDSVKQQLQEQPFSKSLILIKGSRGMALERLLEII